MGIIDTVEQDHARPSHKVLEPEHLGEVTTAQRLQELANESARRSSDRTRHNEEGKGVISQSDGH